MIIDPDLLEELYKDAGENRKQKAEEYVKSKKVNITKVIYENSCNFELKSKVKGNSSSIYEVYIKVKDNEEHTKSLSEHIQKVSNDEKEINSIIDSSDIDYNIKFLSDFLSKEAKTEK